MADILDNENDLAIDLLPDDGLDLDPDAVLEDNFGDEFDLDFEDQEATEFADPLPYGKSWAWDFSKGRFVRFGPSPAQTNDLETLKTWIQKSMLTAKNAHPVYSEDFGMDSPDALIGFISDPSAQDEWASDVRETLLQHDRIADVTDFTFVATDNGEALDVSFSVITDEDDNIEIEGINLG